MNRYFLGLLGLVFSLAGWVGAHEVEGKCSCVAPSQEAVCNYTDFFQAMLCGNCGFGNRKENCAKCGKWVGSTSYPARLCNSCGFGSRKENCVKCGKWMGSSGVPAVLCGDCGFGNRKENCVKCGKWAP